MENYAKEISRFKDAEAHSQKTLLSNPKYVLGSDKIIVNSADLSASKVPGLVVIFGDSLSIAYDAVNYLKNYFKKFGHYPNVVCLSGCSASKYVDFGAPVESWLKRILLSKGIPEDVVNRNCIDSSKNDPVDALKSFLKSSRYKHVSVFVARGYVISTVMALKQNMPNIDFKFFNKEYVSDCYLEEFGLKQTCIFDTDDLSSLGLDLILGQLVRLNLVRDTLPDKLKDYLMPLNKVKKYTDKGYILGLRTEEEMNAVGISSDKFNEMLPKRLADLEWIDNPKRRIYEQIMSLLD